MVMVFFACKSSKVVSRAPINKNHFVKPVVSTSRNFNSNYYDSIIILEDDLRLLKWLKTQPREVVDAFKRDFIITSEELNKFVDSLKDVKH